LLFSIDHAQIGVLSFIDLEVLMSAVVILQVIWALSALGLTALVMLHSPKGDAGIGGIGGQAQLFTSNKSAEDTLNRITWSLAVTFMSLTVVLSAGWIK
jgi:preprotein translocase subunit SecG